MKWMKPEVAELDVTMTRSGDSGSMTEAAFIAANGPRPENEGQAYGHGGWYDNQMAVCSRS